MKGKTAALVRRARKISAALSKSGKSRLQKKDRVPVEIELANITEEIQRRAHSKRDPVAARYI